MTTPKPIKIMAIDTSCDDTSVAIANDRQILANIFWSKLKLHNDWGGVVPSEAKRQHQEFLDPAINQAIKDANITLEQIDYFAVTYGPGLAIALEPGLQKAKDLATKYNKPLIPVNHMIGHIYSSLAYDQDNIKCGQFDDFEFPALALTISGGHTDLYLMHRHMQFEHIGFTLDDAIGEAFDKVGRLLGMGFPAGHKIEISAQNGDPTRFSLPIPLKDTTDFNWSFSGLKTAVLYELAKLSGNYHSKQQKGILKFNDASDNLKQKDIDDISASFQNVAIQALLNKGNKAIKKYNPKMLIVGGGVIANQHLRIELTKLCTQHQIKLNYPTPMWLCTDNAAMIAIAGYFYIKHGYILQNDQIQSVDRSPSLSILEDKYIKK